MHLTGRAIAVALLLLAGVTSAGCSREARGGAVGKPAMPPAIAEVAPPALPSRDLTLPPGCIVSDHTDTHAVFTRPSAESQQIGIVDLRSGAYRTLLSAPVNASMGWDLFQPAVSDGWVAWEEVSHGEAQDPREAAWVLYAAPLLRDGSAIGPPRLIASGETASAARPHYGLLGASLVRSATRILDDDSGGRALRGEVVVHDLAGGGKRSLLETRAAIATLRVDAGSIVLTRETPDVQTVGVSVLTVAGVEVSETTLPAGRRLSHFPTWASDDLLWASFPAEDAPWPDLFVRTAAGTSPVRDASIDAIGAGPYVLYETVESSSAGAGRRKEVYAIEGLDLRGGPRRFRLLETSGEAGWWQTVRGGDANRTLLVANDLGPWVEDPARAVTCLRVYEQPAGDEEPPAR